MAKFLPRRLAPKLLQNPNPNISFWQAHSHIRDPSSPLSPRFTTIPLPCAAPEENPTSPIFRLIRPYSTLTQNLLSIHSYPTQIAPWVGKPTNPNSRLFRPNCVPPQTPSFEKPTGLNPNSTRHFSKSRRLHPKDLNLNKSQNPNQKPHPNPAPTPPTPPPPTSGDDHGSKEEQEPPSGEVLQVLEEFEKAAGIKGGNIKDRYFDGEGSASIDVDLARRVQEDLLKATKSLTWAMALLALAHYLSWLRDGGYKSQVFWLEALAAVTFPSLMAFILWRLGRSLRTFEGSEGQGKLHPDARAMLVSSRLQKAFTWAQLVAVLCAVGVCAEPFIGHVKK